MSKNMRSKRSQRGYALVAIMSVSLFASLMLFALAGLSVSLIRSQGAARERGLALQSAEVGLDYARKMLTTSLRTGTRSALEPAQGEQSKISDLPQDFLFDSVPTKVRIRVRNMDADDLAFLKSANAPDVVNAKDFLPVEGTTPTTPPKYKYGFNWTADQTKLSQSYFWIVEVTAYRGAFSSSIRAMLTPVQYIGTSPPDKLNQSFFPSTVVTNLGVDIGNPPDGSILVMPTGSSSSWTEAGTDGAKFTSNIRTNGLATLANSATLIGDLTVTNPTDGAPSSVVTGQPLSIFGRISANSSVDSAPSLKGTNGPDVNWDTDNVYAVADLVAGESSRQGLNQTPIDINTTSQSPFVPVQVPTYVDATTFPTPISADGSPSPDVQLPSMNYRANSINTDLYTSKIIVNSTDLANGQPTRIFIDNDPSVSKAMKIDTSMFENHGSPTSLQIYYGGDKPIDIVMSGTGIFNGVIYAPNATVTTSGTGDFSGAIVANQLAAHHTGSLQLDPSARNIAPAGLNDDNSHGSDSGNFEGSARKPSGYKYVTWQQVSGALVPAAD